MDWVSLSMRAVQRRMCANALSLRSVTSQQLACLIGPGRLDGHLPFRQQAQPALSVVSCPR